MKSFPRLSQAATLLLIAASVITPSPSRIVTAAPQRQVLAFYYQWYEANSWDAAKMSALPLDTYSSDDRATTERQVAAAHAAGISAFVSSWAGPDGRIDNNFATLLDVADKRGDFKATIYFETGLNLLQGHDNIVKYLTYVRDHYIGHASFLRSDGHPVIFFWAQGQGGNPTDWAFIRSQVDPHHDQLWIAEGDKSAIGWLDVFDGLHDYGAAKWVDPPTRSGFANWDKSMAAMVADYNHTHGTSKLWICGVQPGYDDSRIRSGNPLRPRNNGQYYQNSFDGAIDANPDWIIIVTYNEWLEGSQIEPGQGYNNAYLDLTRTETAKYVGSPPLPPPPPPATNCNDPNKRFFSETGFCAQDAFLAYWYANGGLSHRPAAQ